MTNHEMLAFVYENGPCTYIDIEFEFGCSQSRTALIGASLMLSGLLEYDRESMTFRYAECVDG